MAIPGIHVNPTFISGVSLVPDYSSNPFISGFEMTMPPSTVWRQGGAIVSLNPGAARAYNSPFVITYNPFLLSSNPTLDININNFGALGCYPKPLSALVLGSSVNSFNIYVIGDSSGINSTTAIIATDNDFLLPGYNVWRKVATIMIDGTFGQLIQTTQTGSSIEREYVSLQNFTGSGYGPTTFFTIPYGNGFTPTSSLFSTHVLMKRVFNAQSLTDYAAISQFNFGDTTKLPYTIQSPAFGAGALLIDEVWIPFGKDTSGKNVLYVTVSGAGSNLEIYNCGWRESNGLQAL